MSTFDEVHARWEAWMKDDGPIAGTVARLQIDRARWREIEDMVSSNANIPDAWDTVGWFFYHYTVDAAIRARRLADTDTRSASLGRLLREIETNTSNLTRDWYMRMYRQRLNNEELWELTHAEAASDWFDEFCDVPGAPCVSRGLIERDRAKFRKGSIPLSTSRASASHTTTPTSIRA